MHLFDFLFSILITILVYLFLPFLLFVTKRKFKPRTLTIISVINGIVCFFIFSYLHYSSGDGNTANVAAAFVWSFLGYQLLKKNCVSNEHSTSPDNQTQPEASHKFQLTHVLICLNICLILFVFFIFYNYYQLAFEVSAQYDHILELEANYDELRENLYYVTDLHIPEMQKYLDKIDEVIGVEPSNPYADTHLEWRLKRLEDALNIWP